MSQLTFRDTPEFPEDNYDAQLRIRFEEGDYSLITALRKFYKAIEVNLDSPDDFNEGVLVIHLKEKRGHDE